MVELEVEAGLDGRRIVRGGEVAVEVVDVGWEDTLVDTEMYRKMENIRVENISYEKFSCKKNFVVTGGLNF